MVLNYNYNTCGSHNMLYTHSAIIEHTNRVIYLEDDDVAAVDSTGSKHAIVTDHNYSNLSYSSTVDPRIANNLLYIYAF